CEIAQEFRRSMNKICLIAGHFGMVTMDFDSPPGKFEGQFIRDTDGLQQRAKLVISIRASAQNFQRPVYLRERRQGKFHCLNFTLSRVISLASTENSRAFSHCLRASLKRPASRSTSPRCSWMVEFLLE